MSHVATASNAKRRSHRGSERRHVPWCKDQGMTFKLLRMLRIPHISWCQGIPTYRWFCPSFFHVFSIISLSPQCCSQRDSQIGRTWEEGPQEQKVRRQPTRSTPKLSRLGSTSGLVFIFNLFEPLLCHGAIGWLSWPLPLGWRVETEHRKRLVAKVWILRSKYWFSIGSIGSIHFWIPRNSGYLKIIVLFTVCHQSKET